MRSFKNLIVLILTIFTLVSAAKAEYFTDIIVTSPNGLWTDERAYNTIDAAVADIGSADQTLLISREVSCTTLTVPSNITLKFIKEGSINNTGQLTINTKKIEAADNQIFTGTGDIDFADGTVARTSWFSDFEEAVDVTNDDSITLVVSAPATMNASCMVGDDVTLRWEASGNIITTVVGVTLGNINSIDAPSFQLFAGAGDFDFTAGSQLKSSWFSSLSSADTFTDDENIDLTIIVDRSEEITCDLTFDHYQGIKINKGCIVTIAAGYTLTINGLFEAGLYQTFDGDGSVSFGSGAVKEVYPEWWGIDATADNIEIQKAIDCVMAGIVSTWGMPTRYYGSIPIILQGKDYNITGTITVYEGIVLRGQGKASTRLVFTGSGDTIIELSNQYTDSFFARMNIHLSDFAIAGGGKDNIGIYSNNSRGLQSSIIQRLAIDNVEQGIRLEGGWNNKILDNDITNCIVGIAGIVTNASVGFNANRIESNRIQSFTRHGIFVTGWKNKVESNVVQADTWVGTDSAPTNIKSHTFPVGIEVYGKDTAGVGIAVSTVENIVSSNWFEGINGGAGDPAGVGLYLDSVDIDGAHYTPDYTVIRENIFNADVDTVFIVNKGSWTTFVHNSFRGAPKATLGANSLTTTFIGPSKIVTLTDNSGGRYTVINYSDGIFRLSGELHFAENWGSADVKLYRDAANVLKTPDQLQATDGIVTKKVTGAVSDDNFLVATDGLIAIDSSNERIYTRYGGVWHYAAIDAGIQIPKEEVGDFKVGDIIIAKINKVMDDGALHANYISLRDALKELGVLD